MNKQTHLAVYMLSFILLLASIMAYIVKQQKKIQPPNYPARLASESVAGRSLLSAPTLIPYPIQGSFVLKEKIGLKSIQLGVPFTLDLLVTSDTNTVVGYDVVLSYDTTAFERKEIQNNADSFRIFTYERGTHVSISATKNLAVTAPIQFAETPLLSFTFVAKKKGTYTFSLKPVGNESSKLVDEAAAVTYPETNDIRLEIK